MGRTRRAPPRSYPLIAETLAFGKRVGISFSLERAACWFASRFGTPRYRIIRPKEESRLVASQRPSVISRKLGDLLRHSGIVEALERSWTTNQIEPLIHKQVYTSDGDPFADRFGHVPKPWREHSTGLRK
jgi:hypothetical protein